MEQSSRPCNKGTREEKNLNKVPCKIPQGNFRQFSPSSLNFNMPYLLDCVLGEALWSILTHWVIEDPGFRGTTALVG